MFFSNFKFEMPGTILFFSFTIGGSSDFVSYASRQHKRILCKYFSGRMNSLFYRSSISAYKFPRIVTKIVLLKKDPTGIEEGKRGIYRRETNVAAWLLLWSCRLGGGARGGTAAWRRPPTANHNHTLQVRTPPAWPPPFGYHKRSQWIRPQYTFILMRRHWRLSTVRTDIFVVTAYNTN